MMFISYLLLIYISAVIFLLKLALRLVVVYVFYYMYLRSWACREVRRVVLICMICLFFILVGIYANMAEMPGVRQTEGPCPIFLKNLKIILNI